MNIIKDVLKRNKTAIALSFVFVAVSVSVQLIQPKILATIIANIVSNDTALINKYGLFLIIMAILGLLAGILNTILAAKIAQQTGEKLRNDVFHKVQSFSYSNIESFSASNLVVRLTNDTQQAQSLVMIILQSLTRIPIMFIGSFILAMNTMPQYWWVVLLVMVLVIISVGIAFSLMGPRFAQIQRYIEKINAIAKENFLGMRVVKSFVQEDREIDKFTQESVKLTEQTIKVGYIFSFLMPLFFLIMDGSVLLIIFLISQNAQLDPIMLGNAMSFISYVVLIMLSLMIGGMMVSFSSRAFVSLKRIQEVLDAENDMTFTNKIHDVTEGTLRLDNVSFKYDGAESNTLNNISFEVKHGETLGIIGASGSGKSTLAQIIARIFDPIEGNVYIDNHDIKDIDQSYLKKVVSIVLQRPILFSGTIASNIRQGKKDASYEDMKEATDIAQATKFIMQANGQYEAEVYQRGSNFSGGQKQRISIARGLVAKPKILILDDSTSALDAQSEKLVIDALKDKLHDLTKIIVSQKISSITHADQIIVLDQGSIVDTGTHKELSQRSQVYQEILETQKDNTDTLFEGGAL